MNKNLIKKTSSTRICLMITLSIDVFYFNKFHYSYIFVFTLLFTYIFKGILYLSIELDECIFAQIRECIKMVDAEKTIIEYYTNPEAPFNIKNYFLSDESNQCKSLEEALSIFKTTFKELKTLRYLENCLKIPVLFSLFIRIFYVIIFSYIIWYYSSDWCTKS
jgi:hypothetical protein